MPLLGVHLSLLIGRTVPLPATASLVDALERAEVEHNDQGSSALQLTFRVGQSGALGLPAYTLLEDPRLAPGSRVILTVAVGAVPAVLFDGIVTNAEFNPGQQPGTSTLTLTGEDVSVMMGLEEKSVEHPAMPDPIIVMTILASYAQYGVIPVVIPPTTLDVPLPTDRIPVQQGTDLDYIRSLATEHGHVFYIKPGPAPGTNTAYWGPPETLGVPQPALSVNMGPFTNVDTFNARADGLSQTLVSGRIQDRDTNQGMPVTTVSSTRVPLSASPALTTNRALVRTRLLRESGLNSSQAMGRAQALVDAAADRAVTATGTLDASRYGNLLQPRKLVGVRGAGLPYDGHWYVSTVRHVLQKGSYKQNFTLRRDGLGALLPVVIP